MSRTYPPHKSLTMNSESPNHCHPVQSPLKCRVSALSQVSRTHTLSTEDSDYSLSHSVPTSSSYAYDPPSTPQGSSTRPSLHRRPRTLKKLRSMPVVDTTRHCATHPGLREFSPTSLTASLTQSLRLDIRNVQDAHTLFEAVRLQCVPIPLAHYQHPVGADNVGM